VHPRASATRVAIMAPSAVALPARDGAGALHRAERLVPADGRDGPDRPAVDGAAVRSARHPTDLGVTHLAWAAPAAARLLPPLRGGSGGLVGRPAAVRGGGGAGGTSRPHPRPAAAGGVRAPGTRLLWHDRASAHRHRVQSRATGNHLLALSL